MWFDYEDTYRATLAYMTTSRMPSEIVEDEDLLFDRTSFCIVTTVENETDIDAVRASLEPEA